MEPKIKKILFYAGSSYGFRSMPIWQLYNISQVYPTILLSEKLDPETEKIVNNKKFFPKLQKQILIQHPSNSPKLMIKNNRALYKTAQNVIRHYKPDVLMVSCKHPYPFSLYLRRIAKRAGVINVCPMGPKLFGAKEFALWSAVTSAHLKKTQFLPFGIRILLVKSRKQLGHFFYYWILPALVGELPFRKESSCTLYSKHWGKNIDYYMLFSKKDYHSYKEECIPAKKLYFLSSPYPSGYNRVRKFLKERSTINTDNTATEDKKKIVTFMWPDLDIGIKQENLALIKKEEIKEQRIKTITLITQILKGWIVYIKPHPNTKPHDFLEIKKTFGSPFNTVEVVDPSEWADAYTEISDVIIGSSPASLTLYTAALICPSKPILPLDFNHELLGDSYKNFNGVEYIDTEEKLMAILESIRDTTYSKEYQTEKKSQSEPKKLKSVIELLEHIFSKGKLV